MIELWGKIDKIYDIAWLDGMIGNNYIVKIL